MVVYIGHIRGPSYLHYNDGDIQTYRIGPEHGAYFSLEQLQHPDVAHLEAISGLNILLTQKC